MVKKISPASVEPQPSILQNVVLGALVFLATLIAYLPSFSGVFIWNDSDYVTDPSLRSGWGLARIWMEIGATQQYYPLLHSAFWVQHRLFGDNPLGYHVVTLLLHAGSAVLFALLLRRLLAKGTEQPDKATPWVAALLFALHPVHVESVAWITEQKNTLSLVFYLAAALIYLRFDETRRLRTYFAALVWFVASMWCKTVTATLPAALLVVFWWKRGRLDWRRDILPLLPFLAAGAAAGMLSSWVEKTYLVARGAEFDLPMTGRVLVAGRAVWFYVGKLVWPFDLNFVYPRWTVDPAVWWQWLFPLGVLAAAAALWVWRHRSRAPLAAFLFFIGSLFPVLGFVNLYGALYSWVWDHWQYLPDLGPIALAAAGLTAGWRWVATRARWLGQGLAAVLAVSLGALTWSHCAMFHDDQTLYRMTIERNPHCWMAHNNLGAMLLTMPGRLDDAVAEFEEVLRVKPDHAKAHSSLGMAWLQMPGRLNDAIAQLEEALRLDPYSFDAHYNLGIALSKIPGRSAEVIAQYREVLRLKPDHVEAHINLGCLFSEMPGRTEEAVAQFQEAVRLKPDYALGWYNLGAGLAHLGNLQASAAAFQEVLRLKPDDPAAQQALAQVLRKAGQH
jgi:Flp pilus assembly protein TadD